MRIGGRGRAGTCIGLLRSACPKPATCADWTAAQAWAVLDILEALHRHIWDHYEHPLCELLIAPSEPMEDHDLDEQHGPIEYPDAPPF